MRRGNLHRVTGLTGLKIVDRIMNILKKVCLFFLAGNYASGQVLSIQLTESPTIEFLGKTGSFFVTAETNKGKDSFDHSLNINTYENKNLNLIHSVEINSRDHNDESECFLIDSIVYITQADLAGKYKKLLLRNFEFSDKPAADEALEIFNFNQYTEKRNLSSENYSFHTKVSTSGKKLLFIYENDYLPELDNEVKVRVLYGRDSLSDIKTLKIPYGCDISRTRSFLFDDSEEGEVLYVLVSLYDPANKKNKKVIHTKLFKFNLNTSKENVTEIPVGSDYSSCKMEFSNGKLLIAFLKKNDEATMLTGLKFVLVHDTLEFLSDLNFNESLSTKWKFYNKSLNPNWGTLNSGRSIYKIRSLEMVEQSNIVAIVEANQRESILKSSTPSSAAMSMPNFESGKSTFYAGDLLIAGVNITSDTQYLEAVKKNQEFERSTFLSYLLLDRGPKMQLLFSDKDEKKSDLVTSSYELNNYLISDTVVEGQVNDFTNDVLKNESKLRIQTGSYQKLSDNIFIIAATIKGNDSCLLKCKLND